MSYKHVFFLNQQSSVMQVTFFVICLKNETVARTQLFRIFSVSSLKNCFRTSGIQQEYVVCPTTSSQIYQVSKL
jgi:hypothetical protein